MFLHSPIPYDGSDVRVDLRIPASLKGSFTPAEAIYWSPSGSTYVLVKSRSGEFTVDGQRVKLVAIDNQGIIRYEVSRANVFRGENLDRHGRIHVFPSLEEQLAAARHFGLNVSSQALERNPMKRRRKSHRYLSENDGESASPMSLYRPASPMPYAPSVETENPLSTQAKWAIGLGAVAVLGVGGYFWYKHTKTASAANNTPPAIPAGQSATVTLVAGVVGTPGNMGSTNVSKSNGTLTVIVPASGGSIQSVASSNTAVAQSQTLTAQAGNTMSSWSAAFGPTQAGTTQLTIAWTDINNTPNVSILTLNVG